MGAQAVRLSNVDIDNALKNKDFEVLFQPIFDLGNGALARVETFVRWRHPMLGVLPPGAFISFFESQGRMSELTRYVLDQALTQYSSWRGASAPGFSINLALSDLSDEAFASHFNVLLRERGFPADLITLECPMPPLTMDAETAAVHFGRLAETGARLAIEVRGRANDFLRTIDPFPFDEIKTGGAAILRFARTVRGPGLSAISELLDIANQANAAITAVGVEDQASLSALRGLGFAAAQGNHLGKVGLLSAFTPSRVNEVRALLGLEALSPQDLQALFRTEAPTPKAAEGAATADTPAIPEGESRDDALVERLAQRLARQAASETSVSDTAPEPADSAAAPRPSFLKAAAVKAAAIARAKRKAAAGVQTAAPAGESAKDVPAPNAETLAPRSLQERLSREFSTGAYNEPPSEPIVAESEDETDGDQTFAFTAPSATPKSPAKVVSANPAEAKHADPKSIPVAKDVATTSSPERAAASAPAGGRDAVETRELRARVQNAPQANKSMTESAAKAKGAHSFVSASLAVGQTGAHFRPGIRISVVGPAAQPPDETDKTAVYARATVTPESQSGLPDADIRGSLDADAPENFEIPDQGETSSGDDAIADATGEKWVAGDEGASEKRRRPRTKNILTRKYQVWPTHFWPRSWKRSWRRRAADRSRFRAERDAAE